MDGVWEGVCIYPKLYFYLSGVYIENVSWKSLCSYNDFGAGKNESEHANQDD